ncbi:DUF4411 family protein [Rothia nasisuis]|uniref:DUF4411 family protein n=1 Tax=Rothia nasisuis TaxID=2109647 RepID=UPI001F26AEE7|nr:DUF4411 family protein [Rothia nasisuis]
MFLVDTNILVEAYRRYYAFDLVPSFWEFLDRNFDAGSLVSIKPVLDELKEGNDALTEWAKNRSHFFRDIADATTIQAMGEIADWVKQQGYWQSAVDEFLGIADYFLVAYAAAHGLTVLTHELPRPESKKRVLIPDVCRAFGVDYVDTFTMMRALGARF